MTAPLTRRDLDHRGCQMPGCTESHEGGIYLHARCHTNAPVETFYQHGVLTFRCKRCSELVAEIAVAESPP